MNCKPSPVIEITRGQKKPSLRARQKEVRKNQMIEAARKLFIANGYSKTSIEAIAETAEVGVATVYTYFENKEGLAAALIRSDVSQIFEEVDRVCENLPDDPAEAVVKVIDVFVNFHKFISAELLHEFANEAKIDGPVGEVWAWTHKSQIGAIAQVLIRRKEMGRVAASLDVDTAAALIIDLMDRHFNKLTTPRNMTGIEGQLEKFIHLLFADWT
ncbi:TetR/AcrR family transcriptional regulator [Sphingorhabdus sp. SMR4y]|uniref:TetR/AcrR family transcriptional regulator n=1 Tax=Sphingorhabdus sp. SMR4y TaxID=2584094 RepID=UPI000B5C81C5|nr:TetR/AcrR family transcriptional regulator [Sphingorhabdus sp. SMR4y]ASK89694.1 HTH-type transcriptional repressor Bm3R1 [Sphingorhabdus sp. SMR4y]